MDCSTKKLQHCTIKQAIKHVLRLNVLKNKVLVPYLCKECGYYHVGHQKRD